MADVFDKKTRSRIMSRIRSKNTKPELTFRKLLKKAKINFSTYSKLPGTPDMVFSKKKVAVFIDGEFWHGYNWRKRGIKPANAFWRKKLLRNMARDKGVNRELRRIGWKVVRILETQVIKRPGYALQRVKRALGAYTERIKECSRFNKERT